MFHRRGFFTILAISCVLQAQCADKYTDENRPYEFGFKIDGEQHRHEKKDENGLIMGEFGFITADGVYHVTVYATDENGNFKILSMKNIRVKPYPTGPERASPDRTGHSLPFPPSQNPPQTQGPVPQKPEGGVSGPSKASPAKSCSSCSIPTTTTPKPILTDIAIVARDQPNNQGFQGVGQQYPQQNNPAQNYPQSGLNQNYPQAGSGQNYPQGGSGQGFQGVGQQYPQQNNPAQNIPQSGLDQNYPQAGSGQNYPQGGSGQNYPQGVSGVGENYPQGNVGAQSPQQGSPGEPGRTLQAPFGNTGGERSPKQFTDYPQGTAGNVNPGAQRGAEQFGPGGSQDRSGPFGPAGSGSSGGQFGPGGPNGGNGQFGPAGGQTPSKPTLISAQMQIVDKNTDIYQRKPGEKEGLPDGLNKNDMQQLLYTFNYTVGFHGHFEEGYTNGAKQGYYYVTGRNGVRTRVDYVADEKGFRPKITQEVLDLLSDDVPKPETEKDEKYGLKGYEFKWLYYPVESSSR